MKEMSNVVKEFLTKSNNYTETSNAYPPQWEAKIQDAVNLKRHGKYIEAIEIYINLLSESHKLYSGILMFMYKVVAPSGYIFSALQLLNKGKSIYDKSPDQLALMLGLESNFDVHYKKLLFALRNESELREYLSSISGNSNYQLLRSYKDIVKELVDTK
jgi:hypothetical protein